MPSAHISSVTQAGIRKEVRSSSVPIFADSLTRASHRKSSWDTLGRLVLWGVGGPNAIAHWYYLFTMYSLRVAMNRTESTHIAPNRRESTDIKYPSIKWISDQSQQVPHALCQSPGINESQRIIQF